MKEKKKLRTHYRLQETKEKKKTNTMWDHGTKKDICGKTGKIRLGIQFS